MAEFVSSTVLPFAWDVAGKVAFNLISSAGRLCAGTFPGDPAKSRRILVAGRAGSGKTSLINALTGMSLKIGDGAAGVTFNCHAVEERIYRKHGSGEAVKLEFIDTVGFDDGARGAYSDGEELCSDAAFRKMMKLLRATSKLDLIIYVMKRGRLSTAETACYELLVKKIANGLRHSDGVVEKKIPVLLVITHCEKENPDNLQHWLQERAGDVHIPGKKFVPNGSNHQALSSAGLDNAHTICTSFFDEHCLLGQLQQYVECRNISVQILLDRIVDTSDAGSFRAAHDGPQRLFREISMFRYITSARYRRVSRDRFYRFLQGVFPENNDAKEIYNQVVNFV
ncbi:unnamed protein product [Ectocarpus sp. CCAP 1310/34]|nr:unnamed protein product [Ectocarpus sp. CCAP 1310/34]